MVKLNTNQVLGRMHLRGIRSRRELAEKIGVSRQYMYPLMRGEHTPSIGLLLSLARVLDCPVEELVEEEEPA
jgi:transcriptional regulator with XRE-family HTH domain